MMTDFEKAMRDPCSSYTLPSDVLADDSITKSQKIQILKQWEFDAKELLVADEENMPGDTPSMLNRVKQALNELQ